ncbi:MAG: type I-E CRISPR-associated endoribonuclease Cas2e [Kiritimatiellaeota bacterium]|nr:type I-E CRISPR-associated endoribonuclease Cas2e [Kiritimatiellota bacterium]
MTVIIANDTPPAIRGLLKRWFVEPRPNVFVGSVNPRTRAKTLEYIRRNAPGLGMLVIGSERSSQGYCIECFGDTPRLPVRLSGLQVLAEAWSETEGAEDG